MRYWYKCSYFGENKMNMQMYILNSTNSSIYIVDMFPSENSHFLNILCGLLYIISYVVAI